MLVCVDDLGNRPRDEHQLHRQHLGRGNEDRSDKSAPLRSCYYIRHVGMFGGFHGLWCPCGD